MEVCVAEREGFEPPVHYKYTIDFESITLNHSDTPPELKKTLKLVDFLKINFKVIET